MKNNQKEFFSLMQECDKVVDRIDLTAPNTTNESVKNVLAAIGRKQSLVATQINLSKATGTKLNPKDFGFVYEPSK